VGFKEFCLVKSGAGCLMPHFPSYQNATFLPMCEHFDFRLLVEDIYSRGTANDREREEDAWVGDCKAKSETAKGVWREISK
jgi:hypothetical protein